MSKEGTPETKHQSKLTEKMRTPRTNRALKSNAAGFTFQTVHNAIVAEKLDQKEYNFYLDLELPQKTQPLKISLAVAADYKVSQALIKALQKFNLQLFPLGIELDLEIKNYSPRLPKKSGKPKLDMPCLDLTQKISDVKVQGLSIQIKNKEAIKKINNNKNSQIAQTPEKKQKKQVKQVKEITEPKQKKQLKQLRDKKQKKEIKQITPSTQKENGQKYQIKIPKQQIKIQQIQLRQMQQSMTKPLVPGKNTNKDKIQNTFNINVGQIKNTINDHNANKCCCSCSIF